MRHYTFALLSAAALGLAACGHKGDDQTAATNSTDADTGVLNAGAGSASGGNASVGATAGQSFADAAAASDAFEISSSQLAQTSAHSAAVKSFASKMIDAHTGSTAQLKAAAGAANPSITPNPALTPDQQQMLDGLKGKTGADFDKAYVQAQVTAHQATLDALRNYSSKGDVPQLKAFATKLVPTVTAHLNMAKGLKP